MSSEPHSRSRFRRIVWKLLSVPIHYKILGIGFLVAVLFGAAVFIMLRHHLVATYSNSLVIESESLTESLAMRVQGHLVTTDLVTIHEIVQNFSEIHPDIGYIFVWDAVGRTAAETRTVPVPPSADQLEDAPGSRDKSIRRLLFRGGEFFETTMPALEGYAGVVRVGLTDESLKRALASQTRFLLLTLALCLLIGQLLATGLTRLLIRPLRQLVKTTNEVGAGDLDVRARLFFGDEFGDLSNAFNHMLDRLKTQREELNRKEESRLHLLDKVVTSQEDERKRVSQELHDEMGQSLSALLLLVRLGESGHTCLQHRAELTQGIQRVIEQVERTAWSLRPSILDDHGLESALERHVQSIQAVSGISFDLQAVFEPSLPKRFDPRLEVVLYRVAQEAITNVIRHAEATRVSVVLYRDHAQVRLLVEDNGRGFESAEEAHQPRGSLGLLGMQERVTSAGGAFTIESEPGKGTTIRANIPLTEEHQ